MAGTQIQDTGYIGINGALFNGRMTITSPNMTAAKGRTLYRTVQSFLITNGVISVNLGPNDTASPAGTSYCRLPLDHRHCVVGAVGGAHKRLPGHRDR